MVGKVMSIRDLGLVPDQVGSYVARQWHTWNMLRQDWLTEKIELRKYIFATDTRKTASAIAQWKNTTTIPKLCQTRDNLIANYTLNLFPKKKFMTWQADEQDANSVDKRDTILNYMDYAVMYDRFKTEMGKCISDYVDYGNAFGMPEWVDNRITLPDGKEQVGYVGPTLRRISPLDIVFNPTAPTFRESPKIIRSIVSMGEVKKILNSQTTDQNREEYKALFAYLKDIRVTMRSYTGDMSGFDDSYQVDGFSSFRNYLLSDMVEILTFYGDVYDWETDTLLENYIITVVDRHKIIGKRPNPSYFGYAPIFHVGWRPRQDNLWAMGPLDNLVGMQFRIDFVENQKADLMTLTLAPPLKIKGTVNDFIWGPMERIYVGDDGDVEMMAPDIQAMNLNTELQFQLQMIEQMAGAPQEQMGIRSPGEKTAFEVQKLDNAGQRIYGAKIMQFEENFSEQCLNGMLELARRNIASSQTISVFDDEFNFQTFDSITPQDITGAGKLKPFAARHFAEQAELLQNLNNFFNSHMGADPAVMVHFSTIQISKLMEEIFAIKDYKIVQPYIRLAEAADGQRLAQAHQQQVQMEAQTPAGLHPDDHSMGPPSGPQPAGPAPIIRPQQIDSGPPVESSAQGRVPPGNPAANVSAANPQQGPIA